MPSTILNWSGMHWMENMSEPLFINKEAASGAEKNRAGVDGLRLAWAILIAGPVGRQKNNLGSWFFGNDVKLHFSDMFCVELDVVPADTHNPKSGFFLSFFNFSSFSYKYFAHGILLLLNG